MSDAERHLRAVPDPDESPDGTAASKRRRRRRYYRTRKDGTRAYPVRYTKPDGSVGQETFDTVQAADAFRAELRKAKRMGVAVDLTTTVEDVARQWGPAYVDRQEDKTQLMHIGNLTNRMLPWAGPMRIAQWTRKTSDDYVAWLATHGDVLACRREDGSRYGRWDRVPVDHPDRRPASASTIRTAVQTGSLVMQHAMKLGLRIDNPFHRIDRPREEAPDRRALTVDELEMIGVACEVLGKPRDRALILMRAVTGIRMQDARALEWRDVDLENGWVTVRRAADHRGKVKATKTKERERRTPLRGFGLDAMREWHSVSPTRRGLCFPNEEGRILSPSNWRRDSWVPLLRAAARGLEWRLAAQGVDAVEIGERTAALLKTVPHELRHTFPSLASASGKVPQSVAMAWGGWKSPAMWKRYEHLYDEASERAADGLGSWLDGE